MNYRPSANSKSKQGQLAGRNGARPLSHSLRDRQPETTESAFECMACFGANQSHPSGAIRMQFTIIAIITTCTPRIPDI